MEKILGNYSAASKKANEIENIFNKIMSPIRKEVDPNLIGQLTILINNNIQSSQLVIDLIQNKMHSFNEWEILISLQILEAVVKNCGEPIHELVSRFRFLNQLVKLVSPKYFADRTSEKVKIKCIELMYCWSRDLPKRTKFAEAYQMIKSQGLIKEDPVYVDQLIVSVPPRPKEKVFEEEEKLALLLKSKNPKDLESANKLIKNMFNKDEIKVEKTSMRSNELEQINNGIKLLGEMLNEYDTKKTSRSEKETIKYLYDVLESMHPKIIQIATETEENDDSIGYILNMNDLCESVMKKFDTVFKNSPSFDVLCDDELVDLSSTEADRMKTDNKDLKAHKSEFKTENTLLELEEIFSISDKNENIIESKQNPIEQNLILLKPEVLYDKPNNVPIKNLIEKSKHSPKETNEKSSRMKAFDELNELGRSLMENTLKTQLNSMKIDKIVPANSTNKDKQIN